MQDAESVLGVWPPETREPAQELTKKYGEPDEIAIHALTWNGVEPWKYVRVYRSYHEHAFPASHIDCIEAVLFHHVPTERISELSRYHGGVSYIRTTSELHIFCKDLATVTYIANVAQDMIQQRLTAEEARKQLNELLHGSASQEVAVLTFLPDGMPDPDKES